MPNNDVETCCFLLLQPSLSVHGLFSQPCAGMFVLSRPAVSTPTHLKATPDEAQPTDRRTDRIAPIGQVTT